MSLQTRLTSLIQAVGADIKSLRTDVGLLTGSAQPKALHFYIAAAQTLGAGNPVNWTGEYVDTANIRNANLTSIVLPAGVWWIEASVRPDTALTAGAYVQAMLQVDGVSRQEGIAVQVSGSTSPRCVIPGITVVSDGTTAIRVIVYSSTTGGTFPSTYGAGVGGSISAVVAGGARGPQGDPGTISVVKTLNWNTAVLPNFYRSTNDGLEQTINGPGDTLNPPKQAGVVFVHESGQIIQKVWDLDVQLGYTRYRSSDGVTWSAWVADLVKPLLVPDVMIGGAAPQEGDERYFQTAAMKALGVVWKFRYNKNSTSAYKWEFAGGAPLTVMGTTVYNTAAAAYVDTGINLTLPLAGDYKAQTFGRAGGTGAAGSRIYTRLALTSGVITANDMVQVLQGSTSNDATDRNMANEYNITGAGQGALLKFQHGIQVANAFTMYTAYPGISVVPLRVQL